MGEWGGFMNWPLDPEWVCETCGEYVGLVWGIQSGECICPQCEHIYRMYDPETSELITTPRSWLKPQYRAASIWGWEQYGCSMGQWNSEQWEEALAATAEEKVDT